MPWKRETQGITLVRDAFFGVREKMIIVHKRALARDDPGLRIGRRRRLGKDRKRRRRRDSDCLQHALVSAHDQRLAGGGELDRIGFAGSRSEEKLIVQVLLRPAVPARGAEHPVNHARGAADIEMCSQRLRTEQTHERDRLGLIVAINVDAPAVERGEFLDIGAVFHRSNGIMELEAAILVGELPPSSPGMA